MEEPKKNIYQRMLAIVGEAQPVQKQGQMTERAGGWKYATYTDVRNAVAPLFVKHGVLIVPTVLSMEVMPIGSGGEIKEKSPNLTILKTRVDFVNVDNPDDRYVVEMPAQAISYSDKGAGAALTYALKYVLRAGCLLEIPDDEDADAHNHKATMPHVTTTAPPNVEREKALADIKALLDSQAKPDDQIRRNRWLKIGFGTWDKGKIAVMNSDELSYGFGLMSQAVEAIDAGTTLEEIEKKHSPKSITGGY